MVAKRYIYRGIYHQRGQGIGALLGTLFKTLVPKLSSGVRALARSSTVKRAITSVGKEAVKAGKSAILNASKGKQLKPAVKESLRGAQKRIAAATFTPEQPCAKKPRNKPLKKKQKNHLFS